MVPNIVATRQTPGSATDGVGRLLLTTDLCQSEWAHKGQGTDEKTASRTDKEEKQEKERNGEKLSQNFI